MTAQIGDKLQYKGKWVTMFANPLEAWFTKEHPRPRTIKHGSGACTANWRGYVAAWAIQDEKLFLVDIGGYMDGPSDAMATMFRQDGTPRLLCSECGLPCTEEDLSSGHCPKCGMPSQRAPCSKCGKPRRSIVANFCSHCGDKLPEWKCPTCGAGGPKWMRERFPLPPPGSCCLACGATLPEDRNDVAEEPRETPSVPPVFASWFTGVLRIPDGKQLLYVHMGYESTYERDVLLHIEKGCLARTETRGNRTPKVKQKIEEEQRLVEKWIQLRDKMKTIRQQIHRTP